MQRTQVFAKEVTELLKHSPNLAINFNKFIPAYHQHFGRQCRVSSFGLSKLAELFECIPETVDMVDTEEERVVQLSYSKMVVIVGEQVEQVVRQTSRGRNAIPLFQLLKDYEKKFGQKLPLARLEATTIKDVVELLYAWVRLDKGGEMVTVVDRGLIRTMARNVRRLLVEQEDGEMGLQDFFNQMGTQFGCHVDQDVLLRDLAYMVEVQEDRVSLTKVQLVGRDLETMMVEGQGMLVVDLEQLYISKLGREIPLDQVGLGSLEELLATLPEVFSVRGRGTRWKLEILATVH